jgi:hypothetical protein
MPGIGRTADTDLRQQEQAEGTVLDPLLTWRLAAVTLLYAKVSR